MDAMGVDEFQEADILWPDTEDEMLVPFAAAPMDMEELAGSVSSVAPPVFGRRFEGYFLSGGAGPSLFSAGGAMSPGADDDEEWLEADVLWPDTAEGEPRESAGSMWPFSGGASGRGRSRAGRRVVTPAAAARRDGWTTGPASSSPINIPANVGPRCRFRTAMNRRS